MEKKSTGIILIVKICIPGFSETFCRHKQKKLHSFTFLLVKKFYYPIFSQQDCVAQQNVDISKSGPTTLNICDCGSQKHGGVAVLLKLNCCHLVVESRAELHVIL